MENLNLPDPLLGYLAQSRAEAGATAPWAGCFRERRPREALQQIEQTLHEHPESLEARLCWVLVQLELNQVPLSALTTPILELVPRLRSEGAQHRLSVHVFLSLASRLAEKNQLRLGLVLVDHALEFGEMPGVLSPGLFRELHEYSTRFLEEEIARTKGRREGKDYVAKLEKKLVERKTKKFDAVKEPVKEPPKKSFAKSKGLSSKTIFESALAEPASASPAGSAEPAGMDHLPIETSRSADAPVRGEERRVPMWVVALCGLFFVVFGLYRGADFVFTSPTVAEPGMLLAMNTTLGDMTFNPQLPELFLSRRDLLNNKFQTINSNLEEIGARVRNIGALQTEPASLNDLQKDPSVDQAALASPAGDALAKKEDRLEPITGPEPAVTGAPVDPRRTPRLDAGAAEGVRVEDLGHTPPPQRAPVASPLDLKVGADGRVYGPVRDADPAVEARLPSGSSAQTLDGAPLRSYEVQQFDRPMFYKTITRTNVLSAPSLLSRAIARLEAETVVEVTSRMGQWLELRSTAGNRGYIFAQDAEVTNNPR